MTLSQPIAPPPVPDHELIRPIGRGAYGEVWLALHARLGTLRAVKIVRRDHFDDARPFQREFDGIRRYEPISRGHPNLVAILHVGGTDDCFFYVMELADSVNSIPCSVISHSLAPPVASPGHAMSPADSLNTGLLITDYSPHTLRSELKRYLVLPIDRCLEIALALGGALAHLHARGLVHRDVKPSNVIFVGGVAKLADIGLVAAVSDSRSFVGTEGYIPPEGPGTPSADCYALGKLLYELSTGHDRTAWPEPPADLTTRPDRERLLELNAILHKACAPNAGARYHSAPEMSADLALLQRGQSVKRKRAAKRRRAMAMRIGFLATALTSVTFLGMRWSRMVWPKEQIPMPGLQNGLNAHAGGSANQEAGTAYEMGRFFQNKMNRAALDKARQYFERAIELDPAFVRAYAGLVDCYIWEPDFSGTQMLPKMKAIADKLLQLDNAMAEGHAAMGLFNVCSLQWWEAEKSFKRAIELHEDYAPAHLLYGYQLCLLMRLAEAERELRRGEQLAPTLVGGKILAGVPAVGAGRYDDAIVQFQKALEMEPNSALAHVWLASAYEAKGDFAQAIDHFEKNDLLCGRNFASSASAFEGIRRAAKESGKRGYCQARLKQARERGDRMFIARYHALLGEMEEALETLERMAAEQPDLAIAFKFDTGFYYADLRAHPRFIAVLKRVGLEK